MKQLNIKTLFFLTATICLASCLKNNPSNVDTENLTPTIVELQFIENGSGSTINSGMQYFSGGALTYPAAHDADTASFNVNIAGATAAPRDIKVTLGIKAGALKDNFASDSIDYELMPDSLYSILTPTATIAAGTRLATMQIVFHPSKIDISKSYMLPITVSDAEGLAVSENFGTVYFHVIGNPLAGTYVMTGMRYNYTGSVEWTGPPEIPVGNVGTTTYSAEVVAAPVNAKTISLTFGNVPLPGISTTADYLITGDATFSNITYDFSTAFKAGYSNILKYVAAYTPPSATEKASFHLMTKYNNTTGNAGNDRLIDQTFTKK